MCIFAQNKYQKCVCLHISLFLPDRLNLLLQQSISVTAD